MGLSEIDVDNATVTRSVDIAAPRGVVWAALTTPAQIAQWFGQRAEFPDGVDEGATGAFGWDGEGDFPVRIEMYRPVEEFAFTWGTPGEELRADNATTATFTLTDDVDGGTRLVVVESGFDGLAGGLERRAAALRDNARGWNSELDEFAVLAASLVTGRDPVADIDAGTVTHTVLVQAGIERTWEAVTAEMGQWWGHPTSFPQGLHQGALGTWAWSEHDPFPLLVEVYEPPTRFGLLWGEMGSTETPSGDARVLFTLAAAGPSATLVTVHESGLGGADVAARRAAIESNTEGWSIAMAGLAAHVGGAA